MAERWVALLRGINVGSHNRLTMAELRAMLESIGLVEVRTYIQSGNVVFSVGPDEASSQDAADLAAAIGAIVKRAASLDVKVVVRPLEQIASMAERHPDDGGEIPPNLLHVVVCDGPVDAASQPDPDRFEPDRWTLGEREVYVTYPNGAGRSKLTLDVFERAFGVTGTARNLTTLRKIVALGRQD